ncbi:DsbE family thiol:disulfide interchange protein [Aurantimonas sp. Leaf443]|uniref:DsbE family thiol:disulfide interchange protein n=1 Tax=Aurantimonas sp. Leaf443 TaxID=1736378 RepID=UPI0006F9A156|nr:DsbE family thiol:disulfide interchange protein [Aurantimonas sp. Leaf443]KQT82233.1 thiol:disulfide interchange protein [Aurantimonas sp. Leaf443]
MSGPETPVPARRRSRLAYLPLLLFVGLSGLFLVQLVAGRDPQEIPSVLIGKAAPQTRLPALEGATLAGGGAVPGLDLTAPRGGRPVLVNVFASWCAPCREEHPLLLQLSRDRRFDLVGINYKDKPENALGFLASLGNPYAAIGTDPKGSATIDWGVYGVPESFLVSGDGQILYKQTGPFTPESIRTGLLPALERALAGGGRAPTS